MQDHPKDAEFLNCPIRFYEQMGTILGASWQLVGIVASNEPLGASAYSNDTTTAKMEGTFGSQQVDEKADLRESSKATKILTPSVGGKRKRTLLQ